MLSMIEVTCPHCGTQGQIMLPPLGAIIIGPCPKCEEMVVVFCGQVLALDKEIMMDAPLEDKRAHLSKVLTGFIEERVDALFGENSMGGAPKELDMLAAAGGGSLDDEAGGAGGATQSGGPISLEEFDSFVNVDLKLIDNLEYFRAVFDPNGE